MDGLENQGFGVDPVPLQGYLLIMRLRDDYTNFLQLYFFEEIKH